MVEVAACSENREKLREGLSHTESASVPRICSQHYYLSIREKVGKTKRQKEMKSNPLKKSSITRQSP